MARISRTGTTDSTGVASTTVSGSGGGRLKFISRNGGLWSNSKEIDDYSVIDDCTIASHNDNCWVHTDATKFVRKEEYTSYVYENRNLTSFLTGITDSCIVEFDLQRLDANFSQGFLNVFEDSTSLIWFSLANMGLSATTEWLPLRLTITSSSATLTLRSDSTKTITKQYTASGIPNRVRFIITNIVTGFNIRNVKVLNVFSAPKHYTPIALSSSTSIIQTGETATLTAELTNVLGEKLASKSVNFIEKSAQLFKDTGTSTDYTDWRTSSTVNISRNTEYATVSPKDITAFSSRAVDLVTGTNCIEFDVNINVHTAFMSLRQNNTSVTNLSNEYLGIDSSLNQWHHIRLEWNETQYRAIVDGDVKDYRTFSNTPNRFQFSINANTGLNIKYKNFKMIGDKVLDTETSNSQGVATTTITSNQTGERQFIAKADNIESETITITDNGYIYSHEEEITSNTSTDNYKVITTLSELPSQFELTFDYKTNGESRVGLFSSNNFSGNPNYSVFVGSPNGSSSKYYGVRTTTTNTSDVSGSPTDYHSYLIRRDGDTFYFQIDGGTVYSKSANWFDNYTYVLGLMGWGTDKTSSVKNIILRSI